VPNCASFNVVIATFGRLVRVLKDKKMFEKMVKESGDTNVFIYGALINEKISGTKMPINSPLCSTNSALYSRISGTLHT
jgi:hypothetical protein